MSHDAVPTVARCNWPCRIIVLAAMAMAIVPLVGCDTTSSADRLREMGFDPASRALSFRNIVDQLNNLDQMIERDDLSRVPSDIIVDSTRSTNRQPVEAVVVDRPDAPGQFSFLHVPKQNVDFVALGVQPGDDVDYFIKPPGDERRSEFDRQREASFGRREAFRMHVARVVDAHTLQVNGNFGTEISEPYPLVVSRVNERRLKQIEAWFNDWQSTGKPAIGWELTPDTDAIEQIAIRLNQWIEADSTQVAWTVDPLVAAAASADKSTSADDLASDRFTTRDVRLMQEAMWLRDVARRYQSAGDALAQSTQLFDWVVRNIQLETPEAMLGIRQRPWQTLMSSRGTVDERAWVFVLLLRQAKIDAAVLALPGGDGVSRTWCVAAHCGAWRLFDPRLGLPIPGPNAQGVAMLDEVKQSPELLRQLDLSATEPYPVKAADLDRVTALIEATPLYLSKRARRVELQLAGANRMVLSTSPSRVAESLKPFVAGVKLWPIAAETDAAQSTLSADARALLADQYRAFARLPLLWKGRVLQFKADDHRQELDYADRPVRVYSRGRDPRWYYSQYCRPASSSLREAKTTDGFVDTLYFAKQCGNVWRGIIGYEERDYAVALDYVEVRTLAMESKSRLAPLARFAAAQTHERIAESLESFATKLGASATDAAVAGDSDGWFPNVDRLLHDSLKAAVVEHRQAAIKHYDADTSPQQAGNQLRAKRLREAR